MKPLYTDGEETIAADSVEQAFDYAIKQLDTETTIDYWSQIPDANEVEILFDDTPLREIKKKTAAEWAEAEHLPVMVSTSNY